MGQVTLRPKTVPRARGTKAATASLTAMPNQFLALAKWRGPPEPAASTRQRTSRDQLRAPPVWRRRAKRWTAAATARRM